ncbi:MAG: ABC transporter ATP-binding protein [Candidatus Rokubacteria bacterium]|nr:ABC transporter ATP-binding protein [Candidatus Rokubacteria bacterium]
MSEPRPLIEARELHAGYGLAQVLRGASVEAAGGEIVVLLGPNGAGKSTLLRVAAGLLRATRGSVVLDGLPIGHAPPWEIAARGLVMVPEGGRAFEPLSVRENLELGAFLPHAHARAEETIREVFALFPILESRQRGRAENLSGGERQMLALGRGLMACPRVLCLDDPFLGLGREVADKVGDAIRAVAARGVAVLLAGQHVRRLLRLAHRGYLLDEGRVALEGSGPALRDDPRLARALLDVERDIS